LTQHYLREYDFDVKYRSPNSGGNLWLMHTAKIPLHKDIMVIVRGSHKNKKGEDSGIRGKGYVLHTFEAVLWAHFLMTKVRSKKVFWPLLI